MDAKMAVAFSKVAILTPHDILKFKFGSTGRFY